MKYWCLESVLDSCLDFRNYLQFYVQSLRSTQNYRRNYCWGEWQWSVILPMALKLRKYSGGAPFTPHCTSKWDVNRTTIGTVYGAERSLCNFLLAVFYEVFLQICLSHTNSLWEDKNKALPVRIISLNLSFFILLSIRPFSYCILDNKFRVVIENLARL